MNQNAKRSLLTRFCGLYSVKVADAGGLSNNDEEEKYFLVMNSVFPPEASQFISERFDLKGSTVGRECSEEEKLAKGSHAVLKDVDILKEVEVMRSISPTFALPDCGICIGPAAKAALLSQLRRDLALLVECSVMDYSLLVGVVNMDVVDSDSAKTITKNEIDKLLRANKNINRSRTLRLLNTLSRPLQELGAPAMTVCRSAYSGVQNTLSTVLTLPFPYYGADKCGVDGGCFSIMRGRRLGKRAVYYMGIIDFLQPWTTQKVLENQLKGVLGYNRSAISCVHPEEYAERFLNFMDKVIT
jgi:Phosphatidylinositol-4-phosphate 5-kinase